MLIRGRWVGFFETLPLAVLDGGIVSEAARGVTARF